jgi:hypothetical protein
MADVKTSEVIEKIYHSTQDHEIIHSVRSLEAEQLSVRLLLRKKKSTNMAGSWILKLTFCFMTTYEQLHYSERSFMQWKILDIPTSFIWIIIFCNGPFEYEDGGIFKLLRCIRNLHHSTWDYKLLYADRFLEDEQL